MSEFAIDADALYGLRKQRKELDNIINITQERLLNLMEESGHDRMEVGTKTLIVVRPTKDFLDELTLKTEAGKQLWQSISRRTYDKRRAEIALDRGTLSPFLLQKHTHTMSLKPYIRINI